MGNSEKKKHMTLLRGVMERRKTDTVFKMKLSLLPGGVINILYVTTKLLAGIASRSFWFIALSAYYALLLSIRFYLLGHIRKNDLGKHTELELKKAKNCGILLLAMSLALGVIVFFMTYLNRGYRYPGLLIYVMGGYSLYSVTTATVSLFRHKSFGSPITVTTRVVKLTAALVSFLSLETAIIAELGSAVTPYVRRRLIGFTGSSVCAIVLAMSVMMIIYAGRRMTACDKEILGEAAKEK